MSRSFLLALVLSLSSWAAVMATDLTKIDRPSVKLPELRSGAAQYCLLVFGPDAANRVLLVHDGDRLYVDRNGNGDLTEPGETVIADAASSKPAEDVFVFKAGDIPAAAGDHKDLNVRWSNVDHMKDINPYINKRLERDPKFRGCRIAIDVAMPGHQGQGIDGRVNQETTFADCHGLLEFAPRVEDAPVIHFGGPWEVTFYGKEAWHAGRKQSAVLVVGTRGVGPGTTACVAYQNLIPAGLKPVLDVTYPSAEGSIALVGKYELTHRCCHVNLHGDVAVPAEVPPGVATVSVSLPGWPGTTVAATKHEVRILPALPGVKLEPVSTRLAGKLSHQNAEGTIVSIQFSPDGKRLIAGDYPEGQVHVWELETGKRLTSFEMGGGFRSSYKYFVVTPDWKTIIAPTNTSGTVDRIERDGKIINRARYDGSIRLWDLESGSRLHTWKTDPPCSTTLISLFAGNKQILAHEDTAGEFAAFPRPQALSLWDLSTGERKQLFAGHKQIAGFSPDGKQAAISVPRTDNRQFHEAIVFYDVASWEPVGKIPLQELQRCYSVFFLEDSPLAVGIVSTNPTPDDYRHARSEIKFWNLPGGEEIWSLASKEGEAIASVKQTPDHRAIFVTTQTQDQTSGRMLRVDLTTHDVQVVFDEPNLRPDVPVFHPSGKWLILPLQEFSEGWLRDDVLPSELPQPHLQARDMATGALLEDLVAPQAFQNSVVFSPDGNTLATSGTGAVLLWDFRDPPGKQPAAVVGQPFEGAGTLASGKKLDWADYRGKVVLVTYWATWCQPCVAEIPELKKTYETLHERGFEVLAVSLDDDRAVLDRFLDTQEIPWPVVCGAAGETLGRQHPLARRYGVDSIPKSFLIDRQGNIAAIDMRGAELVKLAEKLLGTKDEKKASP